MHKTTRKILRIIFGVIVLIIGLNKFFGFIPYQLPEGVSKQMWIAFEQSRYFFPFLGGFEAATGLLLILGLWNRFALIILFPISLNALLFHIFLFPEKIGAALAVFTLNTYFIILDFKFYKTLFFRRV